jgi:hypothetical protein
MKMMALAMSITDWTQVSSSNHPGATGVALWKTQSFGDIRVRMVEYSPGYAADHWCSKGGVMADLPPMPDTWAARRRAGAWGPIFHSPE